MKYLLSFLIIINLLMADSDLNIEEDFLQSLEEVSEIATKTKLNIDDSPSFVTVLHSNRLKSLGVTDVFEALSLVPGVQLKREVSGVPVVVFRGVDQKGEVKLLVDGIAINNNYRGSIYHYLDFPIEMIKRIEVIRGAGSTLYGSGAISGVVNIITNASQEGSQNTVFLSGGTYSTYKGGAVLSTKLGNFKLSLDGFYEENQKEIEQSDRHLSNYSAGVSISDEHFTFLVRGKSDEIGNAYGVLGLVDTNRKKYYNENNSFLSQISYKNSLNTDNRIALYAGYSRYGQNIEADHPTVGVIDATYKEDSLYSQVDIISKFIKDNELLVGVKLESAKTIKSEISVGSVIADPDSKRDTISLYLNDNYSISKEFGISAGLRYDNYSDFGNSFSPNIGLVYRVNKKIKLKALYSHAYRAPSWVELTSNPDLQAESSDSIEAGLIFKQNQNHILRINFYASQISDMITKELEGYIQDSKNDFRGTEAEYIYAPNNQMELNIIASYISAKDEDGNDLADIANILASTSFTYKLESGLNFGSLLKYISSSPRATTDTRDDMQNSIIFDQTISYYFRGFTASLIVKDLFDEGAYYALPPSISNEDFEDGGRRILLNASMEF